MSSSRKSSSNAAFNAAQAVDDIRRSKNFQSFFCKAFEKFENFESDKDWARQATIAFRRKYGYSATFVPVYYAFLNEAEKQNEGYESESVGDEENSVDSDDTYERDGFVTDKIEYEEGHDAASEDEWDDNESESIVSEHEEEEDEEEVKPRRRTRVVQQTQQAPRRSQRIQSRSNAVAEAEPVEDEYKQGQRMLQKIMYREYNNWYSAFEDEAKEDKSKDAMTADERFQWHCAKVLSRKTDIPAEVITPIIGAWLHEHHNV